MRTAAEVAEKQEEVVVVVALATVGATRSTVTDQHLVSGATAMSTGSSR